MSEPLKRRWHQFNLRLFFVALTSLCIALGVDSYHGKWMRERRAAMRNGGIRGTSKMPDNPFAQKLAPRGMWVFGAPGYSTIFVDSDAVTDERVEELRTLFPEAKFVLLNHGRQELLPALH